MRRNSARRLSRGVASLAAAGFDNQPACVYMLRMRNKSPEAKHHRLIYLLSVAQRRLQRWMAAQPSSEVTPAQAGLLFILGKQDGVLMGEAGAALDLGPAGISGLVDRSAVGEAGRASRRSRGRARLARVADAEGPQCAGAGEDRCGRGQCGADGRFYRRGDRYRRALADEHSGQVSKRTHKRPDKRSRGLRGETNDRACAS